VAGGFRVEPVAVAQLGGQLRWAAVDLRELDLSGPAGQATAAATGSGTADVLPAVLAQLVGALGALADGVQAAGESLVACAHGYQRVDRAAGEALAGLSTEPPPGPAQQAGPP